MSSVIKNGYALTLTLVVIFLQSGYSYYLSWQSLGIFLLLPLIFKGNYSIRRNRINLIILFSFAFYFLFQTITSNPIIARGSTSIIRTGTLILMVSIFDFVLMHSRKRNLEQTKYIIVRVVRNSIYCLMILAVISTSGMIAGLRVEELRIQNENLIDNQSDAVSLYESIELDNRRDIGSRLDLFYGEPSFLAIVVFVLALCHYLLIENLDKKSLRDILPIIGAVIILLLTKSLSALVYIILIVYPLFNPKLLDRKYLKIMILSVFSLIFVVFFDWNYLSERLLNGGVSSYQRYGWLYDTDMSDWSLLGLNSSALLPEFGIQNGLLYLICTSGILGLFYFFSLLRTFSFIKDGRVRRLGIMVLCAFFFQNGAPFSLSKTFLMALIAISLSVHYKGYLNE